MKKSILVALALIMSTSSVLAESKGGGGGHEVSATGELLDLFQAEAKTPVDPKTDARFASTRAIIQDQIDNGITALGKTLNFAINSKKWYFTNPGTHVTCSEASTVFKVQTQAVACQDKYSIVVDSDWFKRGGGTVNPDLNRTALLIHETVRAWAMLADLDEATIQDFTVAIVKSQGDLTNLVSLIKERKPYAIRGFFYDGRADSTPMTVISDGLTKDYLAALNASPQMPVLIKAANDGMMTYCHLSTRGRNVDREALVYATKWLSIIPTTFHGYSGSTFSDLIDLFGSNILSNSYSSDPLKILALLGAYASFGSTDGFSFLQAEQCPNWRKNKQI